MEPSNLLLTLHGLRGFGRHALKPDSVYLFTMETRKPRKKIVYVSHPPEGLFYLPQFLSAQEQHALFLRVQAQPFEPYIHQGYKANREVVYFGTGYEAEVDIAAEGTQPIPSWLQPLRNKFANLAGLDTEEIAMVLVARYTPGSAIGWHRDRPQFGPTVFGVSLNNDAEMRFRRYVGEIEEMYKINLQHGSAYMISGPARSVWQHGMSPVKTLRYSITMRTLKDKRKNAPVDPRHLPENIEARLKEQGVFHLAGSAENSPAAKRPDVEQLRFVW